MTEQGLRRRIVTPAPPAPVPAPREPKPARDTADGGAPDKSLLTTSPKGETIAPPQTADSVAVGEPQAAEGGEKVVRATGSMAIATLISRVTGFIRTVLIGAALGEVVAASFNTANTLPNLITEIVLGSVLTALVVPVLVRAEKEDADHGAAFIRRLFTLTLTLMTVVTLVAVTTAPLLTRMMMDEDSKGNLVQTTSFAYLVLPQIFFYGMFSLFMAILNTKEHFRPGAWAPVANNVVSIAVLVAYMALPGQLNPAAPTSISNPHVLLLGLGTTAGVVVQCLIMLPALRRLGIDLRPLWGIDERLKQFGGMALAIVTYVAISQLGYIITTRIAFNADAAAQFIYQQHWMLLQMPYGIIGVTLLTAIMPRMSRNAADGDDEAVVADLTMGTKLTFIALIPIIIFMTALGPDIARALFAYGSFSPEAANTLGLTISASSFTLIPYALVMLHLRVFYAREEAWTPTFIIAGITGTKVLLSALAPHIAREPSHVVVLLGAANGFGFVAGALIGALLLRRKLGTLRARDVLRTSAWAAGAAVVGVAVVFGTRWLVRDVAGLHLPQALGRLIGAPSLGNLIEVALLGILFLVVTGLVLSRSKLPEVQNLGRALQRIPGMSRFIRPDEDRALEVGEVDLRDVSNQFLASDTFNASPVPPPMSAGVVRGPRLVPGAGVSDGRFRLIRDHGAATGARFWQAREVASGRDVALTFVDTTGSAPMAPATPREAALEAAGVARRTRKLAKLGLPAVAESIEILSYRSGALVVADWVEGSSVKAVAESGQTLHTEAVANALAPLAGAMAAAHEADVPLGLANRQQLRIDTEGHVRLAFPAVLPDASPATDADSFASALALLNSNVSSDDLDDVTARTRALVDADAVDQAAFRDIEKALREAANLPVPNADAPTDEIPVVEIVEPVEPVTEHVEDPDALRGGFGGQRLSPVLVGLLTFAAVIAAVLVGLLTTYLVDYVSGEDVVDRPSAAPTTTVDERLPVVIAPLRQEVLDDGSIEITPEDGSAFSLEQVLIDASGSAPYTLYGVPVEQETGQETVLAQGTLRSGQVSADVETSEPMVRVVLQVDGEAEVNNVSLVGRVRVH
ncbi:murein biosynthesis integral membrane protein MurJ [Corynebacterium ureicelerivorans]|uniref:Membrane protein n=1 Tax=Corynebacterium ureicelerivorans TaxID=401472 RepID=A0A077HMY0_9CORY|nr:murein biosynthesis integral membrane protein MurJ [Corynebacterium ureicelerivorans]AIL97776.1 membrane protein [Corynebacterium ureicelerivorans]